MHECVRYGGHDGTGGGTAMWSRVAIGGTFFSVKFTPSGIVISASGTAQADDGVGAAFEATRS